MMPEDQWLYKQSLAGPDLRAAVDEIIEHFRKIDKYTDQETIEVSEVRRIIYDILMERNLLQD